MAWQVHAEHHYSLLDTLQLQADYISWLPIHPLCQLTSDPFVTCHWHTNRSTYCCQLHHGEQFHKIGHLKVCILIITKVFYITLCLRHLFYFSNITLMKDQNKWGHSVSFSKNMCMLSSSLYRHRCMDLSELCALSEVLLGTEWYNWGDKLPCYAIA